MLLKIVVAEGEVEVGSTIAVIGNDGDDPSSRPSAAADGDRRQSPRSRGRSDDSGRRPARSRWLEPQAPSVGSNGDARELGSAAAGGADQGLAARAADRARARDRSRRAAPARARTGASSPRTSSGAPHGGSARRRRRLRRRRPAEVEVVELTSIRKTIARRLTEAWTAPVFQLGVSIDMTEALHLREQLVARLAEGDVKPTVNDLLTRLVGVALVRHRAVNATFTGEADPPSSRRPRRHGRRRAERARRAR